VASCGCDLKRLSLFAFLVDVDQLAWLYSKRRTVNTLTVNQNVPVHNKLPGLSDGAGKASTKHYGVEAHL
jgi:hypothetical protein